MRRLRRSAVCAGASSADSPPASSRCGSRSGAALSPVLTEAFDCLHAGSATHTFMMNHAARLGGRLDVRIQVRSFAAVCRMVGAGVGIGMVPRSSVAASDLLHTVEIADTWAPRDLHLCVRERAALGPAARALFVHLAAMGGTG